MSTYTPTTYPNNRAIEDEELEWQDRNALEAIRVALGDPALKWHEIPSSSSYTLRRDVEYYAAPPCEYCWKSREEHLSAQEFEEIELELEARITRMSAEELEQYLADDEREHLYRAPANYSGAPINADDTYTAPTYAAPTGDGWMMSGDDDPIESDWCGRDQFVRAYRWDLYNVPLEELGKRLDELMIDGEHLEPMAGYLDEFGIHPSAMTTSSGDEWNMGGITPVFIAAEYLVLE